MTLREARDLLRHSFVMEDAAQEAERTIIAEMTANQRGLLEQMPFPFNKKFIRDFADTLLYMREQKLACPLCRRPIDVDADAHACSALQDLQHETLAKLRYTPDEKGK